MGSRGREFKYRQPDKSMFRSRLGAASESSRDAIVGKQVTTGRRHATEQFEANRRQSVQEPSPTASDHRCDGEPYFVDGVRCEQRLGDRDAGVDANVTAGGILEVLHELDQPAFDGFRVVPVPSQRCGSCDVLLGRR